MKKKILLYTLLMFLVKAVLTKETNLYPENFSAANLNSSAPISYAGFTSSRKTGNNRGDLFIYPKYTLSGYDNFVAAGFYSNSYNKSLEEKLSAENNLNNSVLNLKWDEMNKLFSEKDEYSGPFLHSDSDRIINEISSRLYSEFKWDTPAIKKLFSDRSITIDSRVKEKFEKNSLKKMDSQIPQNELKKLLPSNMYEDYKKRMGLRQLIFNAEDFVKKYKDDLILAQEKYDVDYRYIVGILGIETKYGNKKYIGDFKLINSLISQYALVPRKKEAAIRELSEAIRFAIKAGIPINQLNKIPSSYAGCFGLCQGLPSSINSYFVGKNGNFKNTDVWDMKDNIYFVAYYLRNNNGQYREKGKQPIKTNWDPAQNFISLNYKEGNWFAIWSYNHSATYIRLVQDIAESIKPEKTAGPISSGMITEPIIEAYKSAENPLLMLQ